ncbi:unnamed protein product [Lymnaea stagnalis]|uniref:Uncharacterized protein n=1 Tax=Lymnaea stagnalis TaxID=6523 RepID=A0AAV2HTG2_LYMST
MIWIVSVVAIVVTTYIFVDRVLRSLKVGNYEDKYVLVTGCDSGFGQELAKRLDSLGFHVFAGCLTQDGREYLAKNCSKRLVTVQLDVSKAESVEAALELVKRTLPQNRGLWGLVNNAGITGNMSVSELCTREDYVTALNINLLGLIEMTRTFLPLIRVAKGRVINMASICGRIAIFAPPYTVSKFGVEGYTDLLRRELYLRGVSVILLEPGAFMTPIFNVERLTEQVRVSYNKATSEVKDTYGDVPAKFKLGIEKVIECGSSDTSLVVNCYVHGLTSKYPRTRYIVGHDALVTYLPLCYLPTRISDWVLRCV